MFYIYSIMELFFSEKLHWFLSVTQKQIRPNEKRSSKKKEFDILIFWRFIKIFHYNPFNKEETVFPYLFALEFIIFHLYMNISKRKFFFLRESENKIIKNNFVLLFKERKFMYLSLNLLSSINKFFFCDFKLKYVISFPLCSLK